MSESKPSPTSPRESISSENALKHMDLIDKKFERRTIRKVDLRLLPLLGVIYAFSLIDRNNLGNARINGADRELGLSIGNRYTLATMMFFVPYIIFELPSNLIFRRVNASIFLGSIGILWGSMMIAMGFVKTWQQLVAIRALMGILEAGFFPACIWLISAWYKRREVQMRMALFYLMSIIATSFANIIAYGLSTIHRDHLSGWRWILIVEGIITAGLSIIGLFIIPGFPEDNTFLKPEETALIKARVALDRDDAEQDPLTLKKAFEYLCDLKLWSFAIALMSTAMASYSYGYFAGLILIGLGYSVKMAQLLSAPSGFTSALFAIVMSKLSDHTGLRGPFIIIQALTTLTGLTLTGYHHNIHVRFAGIFIGLAGAQSNIPSLLAYQAVNVRSQSKRAYSTAFQVGFSGFGGIVSALAYRQQDAPAYRPGISLTIALQALIILLVCLNSLWFYHCNKQADAGKRIIEGHPNFRYTY